MRLKKLMSLVLACAMMLSLATVASAADTKVYYAEDFSSYADQVAFGATLTVNGGFKSVAHGVSTKINDHRSSKTSNAAALFYDTGSNTDVTDNIGGAVADFRINEAGHKTLSSMNYSYAYNKITESGGNTNNRQGSLYIMPKESWDFTAPENQDDTFIFSFDYDLDEINAKGSQSKGASTLYSYMVSTWSNKDDASSFISKRLFVAYLDAPVALTNEDGTPMLDENNVPMYDCADGIKLQANENGRNYGGTQVMFDADKTYRIAYGYKYDSTLSTATTDGSGVYYDPVKILAIDGAPFGGQAKWLNEKTKKAYDGTHEGRSVLDGFTLPFNSNITEGYADIRMYTVKTNDFKAYAETATNVPLTQKSVRIRLSNPVAPSSYTADTKAAIVVKKDGVVMDSNEYAIGDLKTVIENVGGEAYSYVDVTFASLEEDTTYTVEFPATITNEIATALTQTTATFKTKAPDVKVMPLNIVGASNLVADGSVQAVKANLINKTATPKNVALIYAVYATNGQLTDIVYVNETVEETAEIEVGLTLSSAGTLKTFAWDNMTALKPYTGSQVLTIAAPAVAE